MMLVGMMLGGNRARSGVNWPDPRLQYGELRVGSTERACFAQLRACFARFRVGVTR